MIDEYYNGNGIWIPIEILHNDELTSTEKILYAEIYYLDRPDTHCFASNEHLAKFLSVSVSCVKKYIAHLKERGYIQTVAFDGRTRVLATTVKWTNLQDNILHGRSTTECPAEEYKNENLQLIENKKENNTESAGAGARSAENTNTRRNFRREYEQLTDDLKSGADIDKEKQSKKKSPKEKTDEKCLAEIDAQSYDVSTKELLKEYYLWASSGNDARKIKSYNLWCSKLDALSQLVKKGEDARAVIQQSLDNKWYKFVEVEVKTVKNGRKQLESLEDKIEFIPLEEQQRIIAEQESHYDENTKIY